MAIRTQGTELFIYHEESDTMLEVGCVRDLNVGGAPADQIDITCLKDTARKFLSGLQSPGQVTFTVLADPKKNAHRELFKMSEQSDRDNAIFLIGWSDGAATPTVDNGTITLPESRTWLRFEGYVADFPFDFAGNDVVQTAVAIQASGKRDWVPQGNSPETD